jgi:hypothetical protein
VVLHDNAHKLIFFIKILSKAIFFYFLIFHSIFQKWTFSQKCYRLKNDKMSQKKDHRIMLQKSYKVWKMCEKYEKIKKSIFLYSVFIPYSCGLFLDFFTKIKTLAFLENVHFRKIKIENLKIFFLFLPYFYFIFLPLS